MCKWNANNNILSICITMWSTINLLISEYNKVLLWSGGQVDTEFSSD